MNWFGSGFITIINYSSLSGGSPLPPGSDLRITDNLEIRITDNNDDRITD